MKHIYYFEDPELRDIDEDYYSRKWLDGDDDNTFSFQEHIVEPLYKFIDTILTTIWCCYE
jgi:hypothetical protein